MPKNDKFNQKLNYDACVQEFKIIISKLQTAKNKAGRPDEKYISLEDPDNIDCWIDGIPLIPSCFNIKKLNYYLTKINIQACPLAAAKWDKLNRNFFKKHPNQYVRIFQNEADKIQQRRIYIGCEFKRLTSKVPSKYHSRIWKRFRYIAPQDDIVFDKYNGSEYIASTKSFMDHKVPRSVDHQKFETKMEKLMNIYIEYAEKDD
ncbi:MAG: hypothetical protein Hyperionvirus3_144 [Hyperionvirus sp.]|uniref:Uncharacterized protein n=1 Tax=Hyperionvirus sp. TaxID=2487770 RepID=A0A3G5A746_9VIRU|nr:MAG: hypothetical protein Hyperionvirus3_144 [Hyperionvirus sp.]